jgi:hypothetical protein
MEYYSSIWHLLIAFIFIFVGIFLIPFFSNYFKTLKLRGLVLYFWHMFFCFFYMANMSGDSIAYFNDAQNGFVEFNFGTAAVVYLTYILVNGFGVSYMGGFIFFNIIGFIGLLAFDASLRFAAINASRYTKLIATLIVFLPSVSFWSSAIGKDSISFMAVGLALWAALNLKRRLGLMTFAVVAMLLVRPHMAGMMVIALAIAALLESSASLTKKVFIGILSTSAAAVMVPFALTYAGLGDVVDVESVSSYIDNRQSYNMEGGGGVDIASMSLPEQLFAYMFRPLVFEVNSLFSAAAALDNLILLFLFVAGGWAMLWGKRSDLGENRVFMWVYVLMAWCVLAMTTANLGIALRQKWMSAPMLVFLFISVIGRRKPLPSVAPNFGHAVHASVVHETDRDRQR